jgi:hypothetical protein
MSEIIELKCGAEMLLSKLWRGSGVHQIGVLKDRVFKNIPVESIDQAGNEAKNLSEQGYEVYFACGEFETSSNRKETNALGAWGYWFDIDCGEEKATKEIGYLNKSSANKALMEFLKQTKLPTPDFIVDSGNGLHVYFCSDEFIPKDEWQMGASKLKSLTKTYGLLADPTRTADIASVLRFPDTKNYKDPLNPKPVKVIYPKRGAL